MDNVRYSDIKTKTSKVSHIKNKLKTDDRWIGRALLTIYDHQTVDEQQSESTTEHNGVGFTGVDGDILTSYAKRIERLGGRQAAYNLAVPFKLSSYLTPPQEATLRNKIGKYANQLVRISENKAKAH